MTTTTVIVMKYGMKWLDVSGSTLLLRTDDVNGLLPAA